MSYTTLILTQNHLQALLVTCSARLGNERDIVVGYPTNGRECSIRKTRFSISLADLEAFHPAWRVWA